MKLGVLSRLRQFYSPPQLLTLYRGLIRPCMEYASHVWGGSTHTALLNRVESKAFRLINSSPLTDCLQLFLIAAMLPLLLSFTATSMLTALLISNCVPPLLPRPRCTRLASSSHPYSVYLFNPRVNQYAVFYPFLW